MSTLTVSMVWEDSIGDPIQTAGIKVDCTDLIHTELIFDGPEYAEQTVESDGVCVLQTVPLTSDVEVAGGCEGFVDLRTESQQCDYTALGFYVGVPVLNVAGIGVLAAVIVGVGLLVLQRLR